MVIHAERQASNIENHLSGEVKEILRTRVGVTMTSQSGSCARHCRKSVLQTSEGNATYLRPYDDDRILFNLSVWESIEHLREYVYRSAHVEVLRKRQEWFAGVSEDR